MHITISLMTSAGRELAQNMSIPDALVGGLLGYVVVFIGLGLLMAVVMLMGKLMVATQTKSSTPANQSFAQKSAPVIPAASGSAGQVKLYDVPDKQAALLMAIVAHKTGKPLNELRFKSIREVKEDEI